jgi:predicted Zn-dependent protease
MGHKKSRRQGLLRGASKVRRLLPVFLLLLPSCASNPKSDLSESEINLEASRAYSEVKAKSKLSTNPSYQALVQRVAARIARASGENFNWEAIVIESPEVNAWCMPGGKIAVYTGILPVLKTEGALAAVLGHEVAHATHRHGLQRYARAKQSNQWGLIAAGASVIGGQLLCQTESCRRWAQLGGLAAGFAITFMDRKFSREDESESDHSGQIYMARAGYDPTEAIRLWERMAAAKGGKSGPEFLSTHPSDQNRRAQLQKWLAEAQTLYAQAPQKFGVGELIRSTPPGSN